MQRDSSAVDRRSYLKLLGAGGVAGLSATAGCIGGDGDDGDDPGAGEEDTPTEDGGETAIVAGTEAGFPPFEMKEGGELVGFDIDLLEAIVGEAEGYTLEGWEEFAFDSLIPALDDGSIDVIAAAMTITPEREETIGFTDPYYSADQSVLVREDGEFQPGSLEDLEGHMVGAQTGTTGEGVVDELIEEGVLSEGDYRGYDSYVLAVQDLENGNVDAVVLDQPVGETFESDRAVSVSFVHETGEQYGFGIRQDDDDLQSALNDGLAAVRDSGEYEELTGKWFAEDD